MQVACFAFDWNELRKHPDTAAIINEIVLSDDVDAYSTELPEGLWRSDSAALHFEVAEAVETLLQVAEPPLGKSLTALSGLISTGESIDELGLSPLTDGCYFVSISPERLEALDDDLRPLDASTLARLHGKCPGEAPSEADFVSYVGQWQAAVRFARERGLGLIGQCG